MSSGAGPAQGGPPMIAGSMSPSDFDEEYATPFGTFGESPDRLQEYGTAGTGDAKMFITPQQLHGNADELPESPNGSGQDSSSESVDSKQNKDGASTELNSDQDLSMDWGDETTMIGDGHTFNFSMGGPAFPTALEQQFSWGGAEDGFLDFSALDNINQDQEGAATNSVSNMASPEMPVIESASPAVPKVEPASRTASQPTKDQMSAKAQNQTTIPKHTAVPTPAQSREISPKQQNPSASDSPVSQDAPQQLQQQQQQQATAQQIAAYKAAMQNGAGNWLATQGAQFQMNQGMPFQPQNFNGINMGFPQQMPFYGAPFNPGFPYTPGPLELRSHAVPSKSRVETQIPFTLYLSPLPSGIRKLHLPPHKISKPKLIAKPPVEPSPDTLELHVALVCTSAMENKEQEKKALEAAKVAVPRYLPEEGEERKPQEGEEVFICQGCIARERKRAGRKKIKSVADNEKWQNDEQHRIIVFNTKEVQVWEPVAKYFDSDTPMRPRGEMQCNIPLRIACYCRHHSEKKGFNVIFTLKDWQNNVVAQTMSKSIMITDDHKTHAVEKDKSRAGSKRPLPAENLMISAAPTQIQPTGFPQAAASPSTALLSNNDMNGMSQAAGMGSGFQSSPTQHQMQGVSRAPSLPNSPSPGGPSAKKRKSSGSSVSRVPNDLAMTRLETSVSPGATGPGSHVSTAASPFSPSLGAFPSGEPLFAQQNGVPTGPPTPTGNDQVSFFGAQRSASMDNLAFAQMYSAPPSNRPSRAPSPRGQRNLAAASSQIDHSQTSIAQAVNNSLSNAFQSQRSSNAAPARASPRVHKVIPAEGSVNGGIEVTILGSAFFNGVEVWFGGQKATTTTCWGDGALACLVPPSATAGLVPVLLKDIHGHIMTSPGSNTPLFRYFDDSEDRIIRHALSILGSKMTGRQVEAHDMAQQIIQQNSGSSWNGGNSFNGGSSGSGSNFNQASHEHLEIQLLKCLDQIDIDDSPHPPCLDAKNQTGHTLLHLAASLGYHRFVAALLARGANPNARDLGGFTPLHMAAMRGHPEMVRRLIIAGGRPSIKTLSSVKAIDVAKTRDVVRALSRSGMHARSRSGSSLHSRASSVGSLRSLQPISKVRTHEEPLSPDSSEESPEYTTSDFDDSDEISDEEEDMLTMRRSSAFNSGEQLSRTASNEDAPSSPTANAMTAAFKEQMQQQFHQFQQSMMLHFQNLPHLPQMPQMPQMPQFPGMAALPDYQAYLQERPFMKRMTQFMPGKTGSRPSSQEGEAPKTDSKWWGLSSYMNSGNAPPAYEELYPQNQKNRDVKSLSAAQAATEAAADEKCASLFDQGTTSTDTKTATADEQTEETEESTESKIELPSILKIGRKNAITKEQQEQFLQAQKEKYKRLSNDHNLFFVWIPLLVLMVTAMLYNCFPTVFKSGLSLVFTALTTGINKIVSSLEDTATTIAT